MLHIVSFFLDLNQKSLVLMHYEQMFHEIGNRILFKSQSDLAKLY